MAEPAQDRWLPIDAMLGDETTLATDAALAPLAAEARRILRITILGTALLCGASLLLALQAGAANGWIAAVAAVAAAIFAVIVALQKQKLWIGDGRWIALYKRSIPEPELPDQARVILGRLRAGRQRARYRRGQSGDCKVLPVPLIRGPFGALLLSSDAKAQGLALWDWFGGEQLEVSIECMATEPEERASGDAVAAGSAAEMPAVLKSSNGDTIPAMFWPRERFLELVAWGKHNGLRNHYCEYLLAANETVLESGRDRYPAAELDRATIKRIDAKGPERWTWTWGPKVLRGEYGTVWDLLDRGVRELGQESRDIPGNPLDSID